MVYTVQVAANIAEEGLGRVKIPFLLSHISKQSLIRNNEVHLLTNQVERLKQYQFLLVRVPNRFKWFKFNKIYV